MARRQYTGLKDKNCKEIYEGAIVKDAAGKTFVYYESGCFSVKDDCGSQFLLADCHSTIEIIGNIYENPELLEVTPC